MRNIWRFAALLAFLVVLGVLGHLRLRFETELLALLPPSLKEVRGLELYQRHFSGKDEAILTVQAPTPEAAEAAAGQLAELLRARRELALGVVWRAPWEEHPDAAAEILGWFWLNRTPEQFARLRERLDPAQAPERLAEVVTRMTSSFSPMDMAFAGWDPYGIADPALLAETGLFSAGGSTGQSDGETGFVGDAGRFRVLYVQLPPEVDGVGPATEWYNEVKELVSAASLPAEVQVGYTGEPVFVAEISSQMESSLKWEIVGTMTVVTLLFLLIYRRVAPLIMMLLMFALTLFTTVGLSGWLIGELNIINVGFAAMLVGLTVDYGIILYQESIMHRGQTSRGLRKILGPSIWGSCFATALVFAAILTSHFPAIAQLGALVAMGMVIGALNALYLFAPGWLWWKRRTDKAELAPPDTTATGSTPQAAAPHAVGAWVEAHSRRIAGIATPGILAFALGVLIFSGLPGFDATTAALRPRQSQAYDTLERIQLALTTDTATVQDPADAGEALLLVVEGGDMQTVGNRLEALRPRLEELRASGKLASYQLPDALWPAQDNLTANLPAAREIAAGVPQLSAAALEAGFQPDALFLLQGVGNYWQGLDAAELGGPPQGNPVGRWLLRRFASFNKQGEFVGLGLLKLAPGASAREIAQALDQPGQHLASWELLGQSLLQLGQADVVRMSPPLLVLLAGVLFLVFRRVREVALCLACLLFSTLALTALMSFFGVRWNLMNILALPLLMGSAADYSIHTLVALRRIRGVDDHEAMAHLAGIQKALVFCGLCTVAGFAALAWSVSRGLSSLGLVCAIGIILNMLTALFLLPAWWRWVDGMARKRRPTS